MSHQDPITALIVDDEPAAREGIEALLKQDKGIHVLQSCSNGRDAIDSILSLKPQLVFLDIQMPEVDGFEVVEAITGRTDAHIIFVTAFDDFALKAFEINALDYLLKPYSNSRFKAAVEKAKSRIREQRINPSPENVNQLASWILANKNSSSNPIAAKTYVKRLPVKIKDKTHLVAVSTIFWIEGSGNYTRIHLKDRAITSNYSMKDLEQMLNPKEIIRIHKSNMVSIDRIDSYEPNFNGDYTIHLANGNTVKASRRYRHLLESLSQ